MESVEVHIGGVKQDSVNWSFMVWYIVTLFGFSSKLKLPQMLKTAHEDALKNSKVK